MKIIDAEMLWKKITSEWDLQELYLPTHFKQAIDEMPCINIDPLETQTDGVQVNLYNVEELHRNCTVQILHNTITGAKSIGWWNNDAK